jgi:hypothetical protein
MLETIGELDYSANDIRVKPFSISAEGVSNDKMSSI